MYPIWIFCQCMCIIPKYYQTDWLSVVDRLTIMKWEVTFIRIGWFCSSWLNSIEVRALSTEAVAPVSRAVAPFLWKFFLEQHKNYSQRWHSLDLLPPKKRVYNTAKNVISTNTTNITNVSVTNNINDGEVRF